MFQYFSCNQLGNMRTYLLVFVLLFGLTLGSEKSQDEYSLVRRSASEDLNEENHKTRRSLDVVGDGELGLTKKNTCGLNTRKIPSLKFKKG